MTIYLKQSTASQEVQLPRFVSSSDGDTEMTALTIASTDIKIWKNGATTLTNKNNGGATHIANGIYYCVLDATDTDTLGSLVINIHVAGALSVQLICVVLAANVYDGLIGGGDLLDVNSAQIEGLDATNQIRDSILSDATRFAGGNIDVAISSRLASAGYTAPNNSGISAIQAKTDNLPASPASEGNVSAVGAAVLNVQADTDNIQTRLPNALVGGKMDSHINDIAANAITASALASDAVTEIINAILVMVIEGTITFQQSMRLINAAIGGKASGGGTPTMVYRDLADTKDRIIASVDADGNRTAVTRDLS